MPSDAFVHFLNRGFDNIPTSFVDPSVIPSGSGAAKICLKRVIRDYSLGLGHVSGQFARYKDFDVKGYI